MVDFRSLKIILLDKAIFIFFVFIFLFIIFFAGNCLSAISSRRTLADAKITLNFDHDRKENINVFAKLARAHNNTGLLKTNTSTWQASGIFIERLVIAIDKKIVSDLKSVVITLDKKSFYYDQNSLFSQWKQSSPREYGYKVSDDNMLVLESPDSLYLERSRIPIKNHFFSSLINWRGDQLIYRFTWSALFSSLIVWVWLLLAYLIYHLYFRRKLDSSNIIKDDAIGVKLSAIVFLTIFVEIIIITVIKKFYNPDVSLILNNAAQIYLDNVMISFIPKPVEQMQYTLGVLFAPFLIIFNYFFYEWLIKQSIVIKYKNFFVKFILLGLLLVPIFIYFGLIMSDFFYIKSSISSNVLGFVVYAFIFFPVLLYLFAKKKFENLLKILLTTEFIAVLFSIFAFTAASFTQIIDVYHFNPVYFPQTQLFFNKVILQQVVSLYGLFPLLLKPIFNLLGVSVINFTVIMGLLIICCFLSLFKFLKIVVSNKILALLGILGILSYTFFGVAFGTGLCAPYLQYWPIRTLGVSIILLLSALYWKKPSRLLYNLGFFCATLFIFFNFDSGIVVFLSWVLFLLYLEFWQRGNKSILDVVKLIFRHCLYAFFYCLAVFAFFIFYFLLNSDFLPSISLFFQYQKMFYTGYFLIPLPPLPHVWGFIILVYLTALSLSFYALKNRFTNKGPFYFILAIIGFGLFSYFEGRSHNATLVWPSFIAFLLLAIFLDDLLIILKKNLDNKLPSSPLLYTALLILSFIMFLPPIDIIKNYNFFVKNIFYSNRTTGSLSNSVKADVTKNVDFIERNTTEGEQILILSYNYDGIYYGESKTQMVVGVVSPSDTFFRYQYSDLMNFVEVNKNIKIFVSPEYEDYKILEILNDTYQKKVDNFGMILYAK